MRRKAVVQKRKFAALAVWVVFWRFCWVRNKTNLWISYFMKSKIFPVIGGAALYIFNRPNPFQDSGKWDAMLNSGRSMGNASIVRLSLYLSKH